MPQYFFVVIKSVMLINSFSSLRNLACGGVGRIRDRLLATLEGRPTYVQVLPGSKSFRSLQHGLCIFLCM